MADEKIMDTENVSNFIHDIIDRDLAEGRVTKVHTRFPPEPNGYLHIGSAKAIWINSGTAQKYNGLFNLRFDDTNPVREDDEYVKSIEEDLRWLGAEPTGGIYYGSDYFDKCYEYAVKLIKDGKAYVEGEDGLEEYEFAEAGVPSLGVFLQSWLGVLTDDVIIGNIQSAMEEGNVSDWAVGLICDGLLSGISSILSFLPQILLLFLFLSILEDSGYMARVAFIMDRAFRKFGLSGKAFMPLIMCFGCGVPGVMATKTLENEKERRMTMMVAPFFSCGAKLPIWLAFGGILFAGQFGDLVVFSLYLIGIVVAILAAILLKATVMKGDTPPFIMELPAYHLPQFKNLMIHLWDKLKHFLVRAATIIAGSIVVIWFLSNFDFAFWNGMVDIENSILGRIGNVLKYIFYPVGFGMGEDGWKFVVASFTGLIAKEEVISTMEVLAGGAGFEAMVSAMGAPEAYSFMVFNLLSIPCMAMVGAVAGEMSNRKHTWIAIGFWLATAYIVSAITYWFGVLCELSWIAGVAVGVIIVAVVVMLCVLKAKGIIGKKTAKGAEAV